MRGTAKVIGAGIIGLTSAVALREAGFDVEIVAAEPPERTTSAAAAGIWMPFHAGTHPRTGNWLRMTYDYCRAAENIPDTGIFFIEHCSHFVSDMPPVDDEIKAVDGFRFLPDSKLAYGAQAGYALRIPVMPSGTVLPWLVRRFLASGGKFSWRRVESLDAETVGADFLVNCTGFGAGILCGDSSVEAAKGHVIVVPNPGLRENIVVTDGDLFTHIFPQGDRCVLGGIYEVGNADLTPDPEVRREILSRAAILEPRLRDTVILAERTGLRPLRPAVRLEVENLPSARADNSQLWSRGCRLLAGFRLRTGCRRPCRPDNGLITARKTCAGALKR